MNNATKYYAFHCANRMGNYRVVECGSNQSEAAQKALSGKRGLRATDLVCITECKTRREAETCGPRIR